MSACIYHDAEAVAVCSSCDFAVCQSCLDGGADGVCAGCHEEQSQRPGASAAPAVVEIARCGYCRAPESHEEPLDGHGFCATCRVLPRCGAHEASIAFGQCQVCRGQFCRKCLGFEDICTACKAKQQAPRPADKPGAASGAARPAGAAKPAGAKGGGAKGASGSSRSGSGPRGTKKLPNAQGTSKLGSGELREGPRKKRPAGTGKPDGEKPRRPGTGKLAAADAKNPTRGRQAVEGRLVQARQARRQLPKPVLYGGGALAALVVLCVFFNVLVSGAQSSGEERMQARMLSVHKAVVQLYRRQGRLPERPEEIRRAMSELGIKDVRRTRLTTDARRPGPETVIYERGADASFMIKATDRSGELLKREDGTTLYLDQFVDSSGF